MTLTIQEGRYYVNRLGETRGPVRFREDDMFPVQDENRTYTKTGLRYWGKTHDSDLIAEWIDPVAESEWSEWSTAYSISMQDSSLDVQARRLDGVWGYRIRRPRTVTMLVDVIDGKADMSTLRPVTP